MRKRIITVFGVTNLVICVLLAGCGSRLNHGSASKQKTLESEKIANVSEEKSESVSRDSSEVSSNPTDGEKIEEQKEQESATDESEESSDHETDDPQGFQASWDSGQSQGQQLSEPGIRAFLLSTHYAGDVLTALDFNVQVRTQDGKTLINPRGWTAEPLEIKEGENVITVSYQNFTTEIIVNAGIRPEGALLSGTYPDVAEPVPIVNPTAFAVSGSAVLEETPDMGQEYLDKIIFLGDSRTYSYKAYGVLSGGKNTNQVWTPRNGTMTLAAQGYVMICYPDTNQDVSIRDAVAMKKPEYMVIGLGMNGIAFMNEETFKSEYRSLVNDIKNISPDTKIMLNSIYPVANYYAKLNQINNQKVAECNRWIEEVAEETGAKYLNTAEALADADGWLNLAYDNGGEGTHLNRPGNEIVMRYIRTHGYQ